MQNIISKNSRYGCEMVHMKLRQTGLVINHKRTARLYKEQGLQLKKRKGRRKRASENRVPPEIPKEPGKLWAMDFVNDATDHGRRIKILTVIDPATNKSPLIHVDTSINGNKLTELLEEACEEYNYPKYFKCDNGPEFRSKELDKWCFAKGIEIIFSRPGKPTDNCHIESFNGTFRYDCLNANHFSSVKSARKIIVNWWNEYNFERPQKGLKRMTPTEYESMIIEAESNL